MAGRTFTGILGRIIICRSFECNKIFPISCKICLDFGGRFVDPRSWMQSTWNHSERWVFSAGVGRPLGCADFIRCGEDHSVSAFSFISFERHPLLYNCVINDSSSVFVHRKSFQEGRDPDDASKELCDLAIRLGSSDNVTVVIVRFLHHKSS